MAQVVGRCPGPWYDPTTMLPRRGEFARSDSEIMEPVQKHILVINDTPEILDLFRQMLEEDGYRVSVDRFTVDADKKLADIKNFDPDLIILDYMIGNEAPGWQLLQLLKMDRETRSIPVILCTGAVRQVQDLQSHLEDMGVAVVLKPFDIDYLLGEITKVLRRVAEGQIPAPNPRMEP